MASRDNLRSLYPEMQIWWKKYNRFFYHHNYNNVFTAFLSMQIFAFSNEDPYLMKQRDENMQRYDRKELDVFNEMFHGWIEMMASNYNNDEEYTAFRDYYGTFYENVLSTNSHFGQYFTPEHLCTMMAQISMGDSESKGAGQMMNEPCSGSGRMVLACHLIKPYAYYVASDLDYVCCMMTLMNMYFHGVRGEVVCKDALNPNDFRQGWRISEMNAPGTKLNGMPIISVLKKEDSFQWRPLPEEKPEAQTALEVEVAVKPVANIVQREVIQKRSKDITTDTGEQLSLF
tara:strand:- start:4865 stop:5725 length:861 start_codon:yes stop_codon:yes gene_type:complete